MAPDNSVDLVDKVLRSFPLDSAAGPSGLRVQHLLDARTSDQGNSMIEQQAEVVHLLARGMAPHDLAQHLAGASLMALDKPHRGVRPIASGEVLRRITGKCLCSVVKETAQTFFKPSQVGVACPFGVDAAIQSCRAWTQREHGNRAKGLVKLDFRSAFNCVDRGAALRQIRHNFPELARWAQWCVMQNLLTFCLEPTLCTRPQESSKAALLGPLIFSATIQPLISELKHLSVNGQKLDLTAFHLDDGLLAGSSEVVAAGLALVHNRCAEFGLSLNIGKCELVLTTATLADNLSAAFPDALLRNPETNFSRAALSRNFELLGAAIGDRDHCEDFAASRIAGAAELLAQLAKLEDPQVATRLMRNCAGVCKITHCMRTTPPHLQHNALQDFDSMIRATFCSATGLLLTNNEWAQAGRGFKQAGLGLRSASLHAEAACLASACSSRDACRLLDPDFVLDTNIVASNFGQSLSTYSAKLPPDKQVEPQAILGRRQQALSEALDTANFEAQLTDACLIDEAIYDRAHLAIRVRHNKLRKTVFAFARTAGANPELEKLDLLLPQQPGDQQRRPADIYLPTWTNGSPTALDSAITAPQRNAIIDLAAREGLAAAQAHFRTKRGFLGTEAACALAGVVFQPMVVETSGAWSAEALFVFRQLAKAVAVRQGAVQHTVLRELLQRTSACIRRATAAAHLRRSANEVATSALHASVELAADGA
ncbi:unnamed protein product [Polarella glacialis]|uniref:Reverse transcriptase domain-containing protein n=1 Tax=Polarella glacialis TaxID=89957 RepID=A0A813DQF9_POLGL|nr:unnamed protein product [Polarella glacialis]